MSNKKKIDWEAHNKREYELWKTRYETAKNQLKGLNPVNDMQLYETYRKGMVYAESKMAYYKQQLLYLGAYI
jgi:hypothetical protein